jgi:hypothetical protein
MMPFFPVNDALGVNLQMLGNLPKGDYEGVGLMRSRRGGISSKNFDESLMFCI